MDAKAEEKEASPYQSTDHLLQETLHQPLLKEIITNTLIQKRPKTITQKAIRKTFKGTGYLSNLLPTGTSLTFQFLSPIFTHQGKCLTLANHVTTSILLSFCLVSCFFLSFTDSFRDGRGKVRYGVATFKGLWVIDRSSLSLPPEEAAKYRVCFIDFVHACGSMMVFVAVALVDKNIVQCYAPMPSEETKKLLVTLPFSIGIACSLLFVIFPTKRHGIGSPLSRR